MKKLLLLLLLLPFRASADYWIDTPAGYQHMGGAQRIGPYATRQQAEDVNRQYFAGQAPIVGSDDPAPSGGDGGGYTGSGDPALDAMMPYLQQGAGQIGDALGQALARALFGDPVEKARREAQAAAERAAQAQFQGDMAAKQAAELEHIREDRHRKILRALKRLGDGVLGRDDARDFDAVDLRPGGRSFFGLGGGDEPNNDPMVVDLRHLRRAAWLNREAGQASPEDAQILRDQALKTARGGRGFVEVPGDALPEVSDRGLLAFQKANADYAKANDFRAVVTRHEQETLRSAELSFDAAQKARADYEAAKAAGAPPEELEAKRLKAEGLFAGAERDRAAWQKAHEEGMKAQTDAAVSWETSRRTLGAVSAGREPGADPFEKAPPTGVDPKAWTAFDKEIDDSRKQVEAERAHYLKDLPPPPPPDAPKVHVHEGVILGTFGSDKVAEEMAEKGRSPFTGKTYQEMNANAFWNRPGEQGAVVAGFGTPEDATAHGIKEAGRVLGDHASNGNVSLQTPQAQQAFEKLEGKSYDRLVAHSNGSPIALAMIERGDIQVNELHVVGGDRAIMDAAYLQNLVDRGKVKRVVVWTHVNDPIPLVTSAIPVRSDEVELLSEHVSRKAAGEAKGGEGAVHYMFSWGEGGSGPLGRHFLNESYYPDIAKTYGTPWPH